MTGALSFAFIVGAVSSVNPCGFALLPAYFAGRLGMGGAGGIAAVARALLAGSAATLGVVFAFGLIGGIISLGAFWLTRFLPWAGFLIGMALICVAIAVLAGRHIGLRLPPMGTAAAGQGVRGDFIFGLGFGTASLSCTLPIFLSVTGLAVTGGIIQSLLSFLAFALGMGTIMTAIAVAAALSRQGFSGGFKPLQAYVHLVAGVILLLAGIYVTFYWGSVLFGDGLPGPGGPVAVGERISGSLRRWLGGSGGLAIIYLLLAFFSIFAMWRGGRRLLVRGKSESYR